MPDFRASFTASRVLPTPGMAPVSLSTPVFIHSPGLLSTFCTPGGSLSIKPAVAPAITACFSPPVTASPRFWPRATLRPVEAMKFSAAALTATAAVLPAVRPASVVPRAASGGKRAARSRGAAIVSSWPKMLGFFGSYRSYACIFQSPLFVWSASIAHAALRPLSPDMALARATACLAPSGPVPSNTTLLLLARSTMRIFWPGATMTVPAKSPSLV